LDFCTATRDPSIMESSELVLGTSSTRLTILKDHIMVRLKALGMEPVFICKPDVDAPALGGDGVVPEPPSVVVSVLPQLASWLLTMNNGLESGVAPPAFVEEIHALATHRLLDGSCVGVDGDPARLLGDITSTDVSKPAVCPKFATDYQPPATLSGEHATQLLRKIEEAEICQRGVEPVPASYDFGSSCFAPLRVEDGPGQLAIVSDANGVTTVPVRIVKTRLLAHVIEKHCFGGPDGGAIKSRVIGSILERSGTEPSAVVHDLSKAFLDNESIRQHTKVTALAIVLDEVEDKKGKKPRSVVRRTRAVTVFGNSSKNLDRLVLLDAASLTTINTHAPVTRKDAASGKFKTSNEDWLPGVFVVTTTFEEEIKMLTPGRSLIVQLFKVISDSSCCMFFEYVITYKDVSGFITAVNGARLRLSAKVAATIGKVCTVPLTSDNELTNMMELRRLFGENRYGEVDPELPKPEFVKMHTIMREEDAAVGVHLHVRSLTDVGTESIMLYIPKDLYLYPNTPMLHYLPTADVDRWLLDGKHNRRGCVTETSVDGDGWVGGAGGAPFVLAPSKVSMSPAVSQKTSSGKRGKGKPKKK
jgi:hypothetical protein